MSVAREEIFGPVTSVMTFTSEAEAIALANQTEYGLSASVSTRDIDRVHRLARAVRAGTMSVNCYGEGDISTPFGGYKMSGFGGYDKGVEALDQYSDHLVRPQALSSSLPYPDASEFRKACPHE